MSNAIINALLIVILVILVVRIAKILYRKEGLVKSENQVVTGVTPYVMSAMQREGLSVNSPDGSVRQITDIDLAGNVWAGM